MDRRDFFRKTTQLTLAAGLAGLSSYLLLREKPTETCDLDFACKNCSKSKNCNLPEAKNQNIQ